MQYILLLISAILYFIAPNNTYDYTICLCTFIVFVACAFWGIFKLRKVEFFGFNLLFTISFFGCCYIFPLFIYNLDDTFSLFHHGYDYKIMTKATCLSTIAYASYIVGLLRRLKKVVVYKETYQTEKIKVIDNNIQPKWVALTAILFFILFIIAGGVDYLDNQYTNGVTGNGGIITYFYVLVTLIPLLLTYILNCRYEVKYIIMSLIFIVLLLLTGSRTHPLALLIGMFYVYNLQHKIPSVIVVFMLISGIILMAIIGTVRGGNEFQTDSVVGFWAFFLDLVVNNRNLFDAYSIVQSEGIVPTVLLGPILAVVPMGQSLFCMITGVPDYEMRSSLFITIERLGFNPTLGLGTNIVGDVYLGGGLIMVLILFYLLGIFVTKSLYGVYVKKNSIWFIFYISLVTSGVFICRGSFFLFFRPFIWTLVIMFAIKLFKLKNLRHENSCN